MDRISQLIDKASLFAKNAHFDQKRKYTGEPYWNHLHEVAITLLQYGAMPDVIAAGYLHDTLEDTKVSYSDLVFAFDRNIAGLVLQVTDVSRPDSGNTPEGKGNRPLRKAVDRQFLAGRFLVRPDDDMRRHAQQHHRYPGARSCIRSNRRVRAKAATRRTEQ